MSDPSAFTQQNVNPAQATQPPVPFNLTLPTQHMNSANLANNTNNANGHAGPSNVNGSTNGGGPNGNFDQAALQARIALAQQMAQAGMQQQSQHEQQFQGQHQQQPQQQERKTSGPMPDWSQLANTGVGGIMNGTQGATREALMKQLQALQSSHAAAHRNKVGGAGTGQSPSAASPGMTNQSNPSPVPNQVPLQQMDAHSPAASTPRRFSADIPSSLGPPTSAKSTASPLPPTPSAPTTAGPPSIAAPSPTATNTGSPAVRPPLSAGPGPGPRPMHNLVDQRRQFLSSLISYHKQRNLKVPPEIVNGERDGAIKMGDIWVEIVELFMSVLRVGGLEKVSKLSSDSPFWQGFLRARRIPNPLPSPVNLPQSTQGEQVIETTTDPVQFLTRAYVLWLSGFEQHMQQSQMAVRQRQQKQVKPAGATPQAQTAPSPASTSAPTPAAQASTPVTASAPTPKAMEPPRPEIPSGPPQPSPQAGPSTEVKPTINTKPAPPPIKVEPTASTSSPAPTAKRKYTKRKSGMGSAETSRPVTPAATSVEIERPPTPKRKRYKVEYKPIHLPKTNLAGWDERAVGSTFPKNNIGHPSRSIHELGTVDMEAIIMGIRSRIPRELGYGLTVLSMLSMGVPEENIHGLSLAPVPELYVELLELLSDSVFGEEGYQAWLGTAPKKSTLNDMTFGELEQLGRDMDFGLDERRDSTGGQTDVVLSVLNLLRNFSILPENWQLMSRFPELLETLARVTDGRLCRLPHDVATTGKPYSLYELARVRRDAMTILSNLGSHIDLRQTTDASVEQIMKVISSFVASGFTMQSESLYGPATPHPPTPLHSVNRAVEAFCKLSWSDANREVLSKLDADLHVTLFESMIKLLPVQARQFDWLCSSEDYLGQTETLALSLYSLAFTAPLPTRTIMRHLPGTTQVITRIIHNLSQQDYRQCSVLVRRLAEILGMLNGTSGLGLQADPVGMSFSAVLSDDTPSASRGKVVERGWLAFDEERITGSMATRGLEVPAFVELDNLWWGGE